jgi:hypothetical protein
VFHCYDDILPTPAFATLQQQVRSSALVGKSVLVGGFQGTRGFGVAMRPTQGTMDKLAARAPFIATTWNLAHQTALADVRWGSAWQRAWPPWGVNAGYANLLCVPAGQQVERHVDATLFPAKFGQAPITPWLVGVLYVDVPSSLSGGTLELWRDQQHVGRVTPQTNRLVLFDGRLGHAVTTIEGIGTRISIVVEMYRVPWWQLRKVPAMRVQSEAFADVLARLSSPSAAHTHDDNAATETTEEPPPS